MTAGHENWNGEADHWIFVYTGLVRCTEAVVARARQTADLQTSEIELLESYLYDFSDRRAYWRRQRAAELLRDELGPRGV
jgi:hypothetical protein